MALTLEKTKFFSKKHIKISGFVKTCNEYVHRQGMINIDKISLGMTHVKRRSSMSELKTLCNKKEENQN